MAKAYKLPSNVEAERSVLGSMLISPDAAEVALGALTENDFSDADNRNKMVFKAIFNLRQASKPIDPQTVYNEIVSLHLENVVSSTYLFDLMETQINPDNIDYYISMVHEQSLLRELLLKVKDIQEQYSKGVSDIGDFIAKSNDEIGAIASKRLVKGMRTAAEVTNEVRDKLAKTTASDNKGLTGVDTGYKKLNQLTHGWQKGDMIILAARPSVGKTALGMNFAFNAAIQGRVPVAFFSLEMSAEKVMERLVSNRANVAGDKIQTGYINGNERVKIASAMEEISKLELFFDDTPNAKLGEIVAKATRLKKIHPNLGLIVIDYLGLITYGDNSNLNVRQQEVSLVSRSIKALARTLRVPIICLAQLNRDTEKNEGKVPSLANLRESGSIEQDADIIMLMYREDYYTNMGQSVKSKGWAKDKKQPEEQEEKQSKKDNSLSDVKILVAKNRNGSTDKLTLLFKRDFSRFDEPSDDYLNKMAEMEKERGID